MAARQSGQPPPQERLDTFLGLYRKIKRREIAVFLQGQRFVPSGTQGRSVWMLNQIRNQFVHFVPASWCLEATGLPAMSLDCLAIIRYLAQHYRHLPWTEADRSRIETALVDATTILEELRGEYENGPV